MTMRLRSLVTFALLSGLGVLLGCVDQQPAGSSGQTESHQAPSEATQDGSATEHDLAETTSAENSETQNADTKPDNQTPDNLKPDDKSQAKVSLEQIDLAGIADLISKNRGKIVLVDIWSTACIPCMQEFPNLVELSSKYPDQLACVSLNVDYIGLKAKPPEMYREKVLAFLEKQAAFNVRNFLASQPDTEVLEEYGVESMPAIVLYNRAGEIVDKFTDANSGDDGLSYEGDVIPKLIALLSAK